MNPIYEFVLLNPSTLPSFHPFLPEKIKQTITAPSPAYKLIGLGAINQGIPVGICLGLLNIDLHFFEFLHIEVDCEHRCRHIGRTLMAKTQKEAVKQQAKFFSFIYTKDEPETPAIEKIVNANHWEGSRPFMVKGYFNLDTFDPPLLHLNLHYPPKYKEFFWKDLKESQKKDLLFREKQGHFPVAVSPFNDEKMIEPLNSLGLLDEERVVGWLITHRIDTETIRYASLFIEPSLKFRALSMKLLVDSILLHKHSPIKKGVTEIPYLQVAASWIKLVKKRILPSAIKITYLQQAWHII